MQSCKKKNNKTLSSFHASFCRTGFFWATTLLNLIYDSIWFKLCLAPFFFSFTWAPTSIFLAFHPVWSSLHFPSFFSPNLLYSLPASKRTYDDAIESLRPAGGPQCPWWKRKSNSCCVLKLEKHIFSPKCSTSLELCELCFCPSFPLAIWGLHFLIILLLNLYRRLIGSKSETHPDWLHWDDWVLKIQASESWGCDWPAGWLQTIRRNTVVGFWGLFHWLFGKTVV